MILRANQKYIDMSDVGHLLACGEKNADILTFQISQFYHGIDLSECAFIIRGVNSACNLIEQTLRKQIKDSSIFLTWTVDEYFTAVSGVLKLEIRGIKGDELVIKYDLSDIFVRESAVGEGLPQPDMIEKAISEMSEILAKAEEISVKAPIIKNNNWWIFNADTLEYEDTGLTSRGEKGEQGLQGIQGEKGDKGDTGAKGSDGKSAYQIWLSLGNSGTETDFINSIKGKKGEKGEQGLQGIQGEKGEKGDTGADGKDGSDGKSAYEIWLSLGNSGTETDFISSIKGEKGDKGEQGLQGIRGEKGDKGDIGADGKDGSDGKSAYEVWLSLGNSGTETDFISSIKGEKGDKGEQGLQGIQGEKGEQGEKGSDGQDGFSPVITVFENTETSYKLLITDKNSSFTTPNLKTSGGSVTVDDSLSDSSENPVQNKVISGEISSLWNQMSTLNDLISSIQSGGGNITITTLFDNSDYSDYKDKWSFKNSQWDDRIFSFDETVAKVSSFCDESNSYCMKFSNSFGWNANLTALCSEPVKINSKSVLMIEYNCTSDGDGMTPEIVSSPDFTSEKSTAFDTVPAFYAVNTFISACFSLLSAPGNSEYYLRLKLSTTNPVFTVKKISVINT